MPLALPTRKPRIPTWYGREVICCKNTTTLLSLTTETARVSPKAAQKVLFATYSTARKLSAKSARTAYPSTTITTQTAYAASVSETALRIRNYTATPSCATVKRASEKCFTVVCFSLPSTMTRSAISQ